MINISFSVLRIGLLIFVVSMSLNGLLISQFGAVAVSLILTMLFLKRVINYQYKPKLMFSSIKETKTYTINSYISNTLINSPNYILPSIILITAGPKIVAYYYIVSTLVNSLNIIPFATSQSLLAEGSHEQISIRLLTIKGLKIVSYTMLPAIIFMILAGQYILEIFGKEYANSGYSFLVLVTLSMLPRSINYLLSSVLRVKHKLRQLNIVYAIYAVIVLVGSYFVMTTQSNLAYVGLTLFISEIIATIYLITTVKKSNLLSTI